MPMYSYKGISSSGKEIKATISSDNLATAKQKITSKGVMLVQIKEEKSDTSSKQKSNISFGTGISVLDLSLMTRQFATLIKANIQIVEALAALTDQMDNPKLKVILAEVKQKVNEGTSLAKALSVYPKVFSNVYINMVEAGESSGNLDIVMLRLADFTESQVKLTAKVKGAMLYPIIMFVVGAGLMSMVFIFVIPKITKIFVSMKQELPWVTKACIFASSFMINYWWLVIISTFLSYYLFKKYIGTKKGESNWHYLLLKMPVVKNLAIMISVSRFCSTLATLLNSGVPILVSMNIVSNLITNVHVKKAVDEARINIAEGASMTGPLVKSGLFPALVTHMITIGERSGELEDMLKIIATNYEDQVDSKLSALTSILEPIMIVCMGIAVGIVVFAVILPMLKMQSFAS